MRQLNTGTHEQGHVFMTYHAQFGHFLPELRQLGLGYVFERVDHNVTMPLAPKIAKK